MQKYWEDFFYDHINANRTCPKEFITYQPSTEEIFGNLEAHALILLGLAALVEVVLVAVYIEEVYYIAFKYPSRHKTPSVAVLSIYPVIGITCVLPILIPRAQDVCFNCGQVWLSAAFYQFLCLTMEYYGGENRMVQRLYPAILPLKGPPCCCWPCCFCPRVTVDKKALKILKAAVVQLPISQALLFLLAVSLTMGGWYTPGKIFQNLQEYLDKLKVMVADAYMWVLALNLISSVVALWSLIVMVKVSKGHLDEFYHQYKFVVLQFVLVFAKIQNPIFEFLAKNEVLPCNPPLSPMAYANIIFNAVLLGEMIILSVLARYLYKRQSPEVVALPDKDNDMENSTTIKQENHAGTQTSASINKFPTSSSLNSCYKFPVDFKVSTLRNQSSFDSYVSEYDNVDGKILIDVATNEDLGQAQTGSLQLLHHNS